MEQISWTKKSLKDLKWLGYFDDTAALVFRGRYKNGKPDGIYHYYWKNEKLKPKMDAVIA